MVPPTTRWKLDRDFEPFPEFYISGSIFHSFTSDTALLVTWGLHESFSLAIIIAELHGRPFMAFIGNLNGERFLVGTSFERKFASAGQPNLEVNEWGACAKIPITRANSL